MSTKRKSDSISAPPAKQTKRNATEIPSFLMGGQDAILPRGVTSAHTSTKQFTKSKTQVDDLFFTERANEPDSDDSDDSDSDDEEKKNVQIVEGMEAHGDVSYLSSMKTVHKLNNSRLTVGSLLLGSIKTINDNDMIISLPDGLTGFVPIFQVSDVLANRLLESQDQMNDDEDEDDLPELSDMYTVGELVRVVVSNVVKNKNGSTYVELSMKPSLINTHISREHLTLGFQLAACIKSVEDKGYVVDIGINNLSGFLKKTNTSKSYHVGQTISLFTAESAVHKTNQAIQFTDVDKNHLFSNTLPISALKPGHMVKAIVQNQVDNGLIVNVLHDQVASISLSHISKPLTEAVFDLAKMYPIKTTINARVLYTNPLTKMIIVSIRPDIINNEPITFPSWLRVGEILDNTRVIRYVGDLGITVDLTEAVNDIKPAHEAPIESTVFGYVHIQELSDSKISTIPSSVKVNKPIKVRVTGFNPMEGTVILTAKPSILSSEIISYDDVIPGNTYKCTIRSFVEKAGLVVNIGPKMTALIPLVHLRDAGYSTNFSKILEKFPVKSTHVFRVIANLEKEAPANKRKSKYRQIILTAKPSLVKSSNHIITSLDQCRQIIKENPSGFIADGFVANIKDKFVTIKFYNDVYGTCSREDLIKSSKIVEGQKISDAFTEGESVKVRVTDVVKDRLRISFNTTVAHTRNTIVKVEKTVNVGTWVSAKITGTNEDGFDVMINDGNKSFKALLPSNFLSDSPIHVSGLTKALADAEFPLALVVSKADGLPIISVKPMLLAYASGLDIEEFLPTVTSANTSDFFTLFNNALKTAGVSVGDLSSIPTHNAKLSIGQTVTGIVSSILDYGIIIKVAGSTTMLALKSDMSDSFIKDVHSLYTVGQTIRATVTTITDKGINCSVKPSVVMVGDESKAYNLLFSSAFFAEESLLRENNIVSRSNMNSEDALLKKSSVAVGSIFTDSKVTKTDGSIISLSRPKDTSSLQVISGFHTEGSAIAEGAVKGAVATSRVIDVDPVTGVATLSLRPSVVNAQETASKKKGVVVAACSSSATTLKSGVKVDIEVLYVNRHYVVVGLVDYKYSLALAIPFHTNNCILDTTFIVPGYKTTAVVVSAASSTNDRLVVALNLSGKGAGKVRPLPDGTFFSDITTLNDLALDTNVKVKIVEYDTESNSIKATLGPESSYSDAYEVVIPLSSVVATKDVKPVKSRKSSPNQSVITEINKYIDQDELVDAKITAVYFSSKTVVLPGSTKSVRQRVVQLTLRPNEVKSIENLNERIDIENYCVNSLHSAVITHISNSGILAELAPSIYVNIRNTAITNSPSLLATVNEHFHIGDIIQVKVTRNNNVAQEHKSKNRQYVSAALFHSKFNPQGKDSNEDDESSDITVGGIYENAHVKSIDTKNCQYIVSLSDASIGRLAFAEIADLCQDNAGEIYSVDDIIPSLAVLSQVSDHIYDVSTRESRINAAVSGSLEVPSGLYDRKAAQAVSTVKTVDPFQVANVLSFSDVAVGQLLNGYITAIDKRGIFVQLSGLVTGRIFLKHASDKFINDPNTIFTVGQMIPVRVLSINADRASIELTAKKSLVDSINERVIATLKPGAVVKGTVKKVTDFGVFITIKHTTINGLSHKTECVDNKSVDFVNYYAVGDKVKAVVLRVDKQLNRVSLGLKASLFQKLDEIASKGRSHEDANNDEDDDEEEEVLVSKTFDDESSSDDDFSDDEDVPVKTTQVKSKIQQSESAPSLFNALLSGKKTSYTQADSDDDSEDEELVPMDDDEGEARSQKLRQEREVEKRERAIMSDAAPQSTEDHEMAVVRTPNDSYTWVQYISYELGQGNIDKARDIANRALKVISVHETQERWNIWSALISLENVYGTVDSLDKVMKDAARLNNPIKTQLELARVLTVSNKIDRAIDAYTVATNRWGSDVDYGVEIWNSFFTMLFKHDRLEEARKLLTQAITTKLKSKMHHKAVLVKFATLEFQNGTADRARVLLESYLNHHLKALDVWSVYIDQETKIVKSLENSHRAKPGELKKAKGTVRVLFDRLTGESFWTVWSTTQMRAVLKKYMDFELKHGTEERVSYVKEKAQLYVSNIINK